MADNKKPRAPERAAKPAKTSAVATRASRDADASATIDRLEALIAKVCATTKMPALRSLHEQLGALDILGAAEPGSMPRIMRAFERLDRRIAELDPMSDASFEVQAIRSTVTST